MSIVPVSAKRKGDASASSLPTGQLGGRQVALLASPPSTTKCGKRDLHDSASSHRVTNLCELPEDLLSRIFSFLTYSERAGTIPQTCTAFRDGKESFAIEHVNATSGSITLQELLDCGPDFSPAKPIRLQLQSLVKNPANQEYLNGEGFIRSEVVDRIITKWGPSITELYFNPDDSSARISKAGLMRLINGCPRLEVLLIPERSITDADLIPMLQSCKDHLLVLDISKCVNLTSAGLGVISTCPHLRSLTAFLTNLTDADLGSILTGCPDLRVLVLSNCEELTGAGFEGKRTLVNRVSVHSSSLTEEGLGHLLAACPELEELNISLCTITGANFAGKDLRHLQTFFADQADFTEEDLGHLLTACPELKELNVNSCSITGASFAGKDLRHLHTFSADETDFTDESLGHLLTACPGLQELNINLSKITGTGFAGKSAPHLQRLFVNDAAFTDEGLGHLLDACPDLGVLELQGCKELTGAGFKNKHRPSLVQVLVGSTALTDEGLGHLLRACPQIQELGISCCKITGAGFAGKHLPHLQEINAHNTALSDENLPHLFAICPKPYWLDFWGSRVTAAAFKAQLPLPTCMDK